MTFNLNLLIFTPRNWPKVHDQLLILVLANEAVFGRWKYGVEMDKGIKDANKILESEFDVKYEDVDLYLAVDKLHARHTVWLNLNKNPHVTLDKCANNLHTSEEAWAEMFKEDERTKWYALDGEPHFGDLGLIYGYDATAVAQDTFDLNDIVPPIASYNLDKFVIPNLPISQMPPKRLNIH